MKNKILLIIGHEYRTRVMKLSFLLLTLLTPILFIGVSILPALIMTSDTKDSAKTIVVIDKSGMYESAFTNDENYTFLFLDGDLQQAHADHPQVDGFVYITGDLRDSIQTVSYYSEKQPNAEMLYRLSRQLSDYVNRQRIESYNIPHLKEIIEVTPSADMTELLGFVSAMLIFVFVFMYGAQVMQGVAQEKSSRIMEVMISSVRPFELMMGKIIGIALVGLTQFMLWVMIGAIGFSIAMPLVMPDVAELSSDTMAQMASSQDLSFLQELMMSLIGLDFVKIIVLFLLYFIGGYLLYASLFAAVGSAVDNETDAQQFTLPISIPIMISMYVAMHAMRSPDSALAFWCSLIPFTSPVVMLVRLPFDVAWWEIILSLVILYLSFIGSTWLSGKIYRTGVLMYGKKPSWKEIWKWIRY